MASEPHAWRRLRSLLLLDRSPWLRVFADDVQLPSGLQIDGYLRVEGREYAQIFALTDDGRVPLIRQFKYGLSRVVTQLPAGYLEVGETPEVCARRELLEETGYEAAAWDYLGSHAQDGNRGFGVGHSFLARGARAVRAPDPGPDEQIEVTLVPLAGLAETMASEAMGEMGPLAGIALALIRLGALSH